MLVNSLTNERTQIVSVNSSWGGVSQKLKGQWPSKSWAVFPTLANFICTECCQQLCTVREPGAKEKPHQDRLHLLLLGVTTSLTLVTWLNKQDCSMNMCLQHMHV